MKRVLIKCCWLVTLDPKIDPTEQAEVASEQERKRLGLGDQPVIDLGSTLEWDVGLRIFSTGKSKVSGGSRSRGTRRL